MLRGIDISSNQPYPNWAQVAAGGVQFALIKVTGGTDYLNPRFADQWAGAGSVGIRRGVYHYAMEPTGSPASAEAEADFFLANLPELGPGEMVALDMEEGGGDLGAWTLAWLRRVEARLGFAPLLYTGNYFIQEHNLHDSALARYPLWLASWQATLPPVPAPWAAIAIWQHSSTAQVAGIGQCDEDLHAGDLAGLAALGKPDAPTSAMLAPVITPERNWGPGSKGRLIAETVTVANDDDGKYYEGRIEYRAEGPVQLPWREV